MAIIEEGELDKLKKSIPELLAPDENTLALGEAFDVAGDIAVLDIEPVELVAALTDAEILPRAAADPAPVAEKQSVAPAAPMPSAADAYEEEREAVGEVHKRAKTQTTTIEEQLKSGEGRDDKVTDAGYLATTANVQENADGARNKREREKRQAMNQHMMLMAQLNNRIEDLNNKIADIDTRLAEIGDRRNDIKDELSELEELKALNETGALDPDNPDHAALMEKYGITPEAVKNGTATDLINQAMAKRALEDQRLETEQDELLQQRDQYAQERDDLKELQQEARAEQRKLETQEGPISPEDQQRIEQLEKRIDDLKVKNILTHQAQTGVESRLHEGGEEHEHDVAAKEDVEELFSADEGGGLDEEIERAMQKVAEFQAIEGPEERLIAEYELVESLSPDAVEILAQEQDTKALFEEGHFEAIGVSPLDENEAQLAGATPATPTGAPGLG